ncbi:MAG TPA: trypsin-like peptidase domain-containing protein [Candidatus Saccharimonadales bacterium]|nr:trypsin-like peptidase domain-containing protein [Candidatus Saccharimonadales bacterium]
MTEQQKPVKNDLNKKRWHVVGIVTLCFVASFLGAWAFSATGLVNFDASRSIESNRETIVLQEGEVVAEIFKKVSPSTVAIITQQVSADGFYEPYVSEGAGSGIVISKDGYILTNKHVVPEGTDTAKIVMDDGTQYDAQVVGRDPLNDLAFLKIAGVDNLSPAELGDSGDVQPGQKAIAVGNALGEFRNTVTSGIISGIGRPIEAVGELGSAEKLENLIQTDAAINPGNSGGPLVNLKGEVIGVNTAISEGAEGMGFAIPINDAKAIIKSMLEQGRIIKPYLGVRYVALNSDNAREFGVNITKGAILIDGGNGEPSVVVGSPAEKAGLKTGDIITDVSGQQVREDRGLASLLSQFSAGASVELTVIRDNVAQKMTVVLEEYPR